QNTLTFFHVYSAQKSPTHSFMKPSQTHLNPEDILSTTSEKRFNMARALSILAHNLKGPLAYVHHTADFLNEHWDKLKEEDRKDSIRVVKHTTKSMERLLQRLFDWASFQMEHPGMEMKEVNVEKVLTEQVEIFQPFFKVKDLRYSLQVQPGTKMIGDEAILDVILQNVISNAIKFSYPKGEIDIYAFTDSNGMTTISIADTGVGMTTYELKEVRQGKKTHSRSGTMGEEGTGMGMLIISDLTHLLNGTVNIESKEKKGSTISLSFPSGA
ncbi:MAG: HAMP domain-containing histidine kinase, partial [Bacteroidota bacterium]|nr:HAMP domain-containing histidine kinase [Bacteroidota bacterium]